MGLFRNRKRRVPDQLAEEDAEMRETTTAVFGPGALGPLQPAGSGMFGFVRPLDKTIAAEELRAEANQEDDGARSQMIESERHVDEYGN